MTWRIFEHKRIAKTIARLPRHISKKYELWKSLIFRHGPSILREFPGFHDERLARERQGQRSSRLSLQYRVIYCIRDKEIAVYVIEITPHNY
jgi:mRNA-degrading endonuclease RelE of RelBE toxin-antitoxin system